MITKSSLFEIKLSPNHANINEFQFFKAVIYVLVYTIFCFKIVSLKFDLHMNLYLLNYFMKKKVHMNFIHRNI